jgi:shikimate kinase
MDYMNERGLTIYLQLTPEQLAVRLASSRIGKRPLLGDRKGEELRLFIEQGLGIRSPFYEKAQRIVSGTDEEIIAQIKEII